MRDSLLKAKVKHEAEKTDLKKKYQFFFCLSIISFTAYRFSNEYALWLSDLFSGNNLLLYGYGSKIAIINDFVYLKCSLAFFYGFLFFFPLLFVLLFDTRKQMLSKYPVLHVYGYVPTCNIKSV
jgi:Origin recognition complex subunit 2